MFWRFLGMLGPNLASILVYLCSLMRFRSFLVGTHDSFCRFLKYIKFLVETRQSGFPELRPYRKQSEMQSILDSFGKKNQKKNIQCFWGQNRNRKYSIVLLKQSISKPGPYNHYTCSTWIVIDLIVNVVSVTWYSNMTKSKYCKL